MKVLLTEAVLLQESKIWIFTDSESAVKRLEAGPGAQTDSLADEVWSHLGALAERRAIRLQWIPGHKDIEGNEAADLVAKEAAKLEQ